MKELKELTRKMRDKGLFRREWCRKNRVKKSTLESWEDGRRTRLVGEGLRITKLLRRDGLIDE
jgi:hypothetical protein